MNQNLIQLHKEILELAQEQESCNAVLGMMLSTAECLSSRFGKVKNERLFNDYNVFGSGDSKNESYLKAQLRIQTKLFRNNYVFMKDKDGQYTFPNNFNKDKIIQIVNMWKNNVSRDKKIYYENIISILQDKTDIKFPHLTMDTISNKGLDPNIMVNAFLPIMNHVDEKLKKVGEEAGTKGFYDNKLKVNGKQYNDNGLEKSIQNNFKRSDEENNNDEEICALTLYLQNCFISGEIYYVLLSKNKKYQIRFYDNKKYIYKEEDIFKISNYFKTNLINFKELYLKLKEKKKINDKSIANINSFITENGEYAVLWKNYNQDPLLKDFCDFILKINSDMN